MNIARPFHEAFDIPIQPSPTIPDIKRVLLRRRLVQEEFAEVDAEFERIIKRFSDYATASEAYEDIARLAKELSDLRFVCFGADLEFGIPSEATDKENLRSNMSKLGDDGRPVRRHDGKVLKGPNYEEANMLLAMGIIELDLGDTTP